MSITTAPIVRQTLPYGDRPFVDADSGRLTTEAYQYMQRLKQGVDGTINNVGTVVNATNTLISNVTDITNSLTTIQENISQLFWQVTMMGPVTDTPPPAPQPRGITVPQAFGLAFFFA